MPFDIWDFAPAAMAADDLDRLPVTGIPPRMPDPTNPTPNARHSWSSWVVRAIDEAEPHPSENPTSATTAPPSSRVPHVDHDNPVGTVNDGSPLGIFATRLMVGLAIAT